MTDTSPPDPLRPPPLARCAEDCDRGVEQYETCVEVKELAEEASDAVKAVKKPSETDTLRLVHEKGCAFPSETPRFNKLALMLHALNDALNDKGDL